MRVVRYLTVVGAAMTPVAAEARDFLYPWKPGVALKQVSDHQGACLGEAKATEKQVDADEQRRARGQSAPPRAADSKSWIAPDLDGQGAFFNHYYDCLRSRGYSIRRMPSREYGAMKKGSDGGKAVLQAMAAPDSPHAEVPPGTIK